MPSLTITTSRSTASLVVLLLSFLTRAVSSSSYENDDDFHYKKYSNYGMSVVVHHSCKQASLKLKYSFRRCQHQTQIHWTSRPTTSYCPQVNAASALTRPFLVPSAPSQKPSCRVYLETVQVSCLARFACCPREHFRCWQQR